MSASLLTSPAEGINITLNAPKSVREGQAGEAVRRVGGGTMGEGNEDER